MAELAIGILGLVPLISLVFTSSRSLKAKLKAFEHYSDDLSYANLKFKLAKNSLERECQILLRLAIDEDEMDAMKLDEKHATWFNKAFEAELHTIVGAAYEDYYLLLQSALKILMELGGQLECFDILTMERKGHERLSETVRRLRKRIRVAFNQERFENIYQRISETNGDLAALRGQIKQLQQPKKIPAYDQQRRQTRGDWATVRKTRIASNALHHGLQQAWSCVEGNHSSHSVNLFLGLRSPEKSRDAPQLNVSILRIPHETSQITTVTHLRVQSEKVEWIERSPPTPPTTSSESDSQEAPAKRQKKVSFAEKGSIIASSPYEALTSPAICRNSNDLRRSGDICTDLTRSIAYLTTRDENCIGHLDVEVDGFFRFNFYSSPRFANWGEAMDAVPLNTIVKDSTVKDRASFSTRLRMAQSVAVIGLTYHSTVWLNECWRLADLSHLPKDTDLASSLQSLHLGADLEPTRESMQGLLAPESMRLSQASDDQLLGAGIKNKPLWSLGVALLGIDKWEEFDPANVVEVRKAARSSNFGERYRQIVERCLSCNFQYGHDLDRPQLHRAVYESVVGSLERMITSLDIDEDVEESN
ncbi:Fc.00g019670.m01.CDS01 [Cosmosporella sp. VM-42]